MSDEQLLAASLTQPALFSELVSRYERPFLNKIIRMLGDKDEAEDIVQETFVKIYIQGKRFENQGENSFRAWSYTILVRTALSYIRKMKRERLSTVHLDNELIEALADKTNAFDLYALKDEILSVLSRLPGAVRRILTLRFLEGLTYEEIAVVEGVSEGAVRTRLSRARREFEKVKVKLDHLDKSLESLES
jgi:RNA polymerase sigma-70 factor (ECF subfamily)